MMMLGDPCTLRRYNNRIHKSLEGCRYQPGATSASSTADPPVAPFFDWEKSTEFNYSRTQPNCSLKLPSSFIGKFASIRENLDYDYHCVYNESRQLLQDAILESLLDQHYMVRENASSSSSTAQDEHQLVEKQWIVFTAGSMGAGKTHTLQVLDQQGRFPLSRFLQVDPDEIRYRLPEYKLYAPAVAGEHTQKEAGYMSELLVHAALERGWNVLVDGSLRNAEWYMAHFQALRQQYSTSRHLSLAIFHVTAPTELIYQRVQHRATVVSTGGRVVPLSLLEQVMDQVPQAIGKLKACVDFFAELHNSGHHQELQLSTPGLTWNMFQQQWQQPAQQPYRMS